jgi:hypothetical protein
LTEQTYVCKNKVEQLNTIANIAKQEITIAPVLLLMDDALAGSFLKIAEKTRGPATVLFGDGCDSIKLNTILTQQFNKKGENELYRTYITD